MSDDRTCSAREPTRAVARCELAEWHEGDHFSSTEVTVTATSTPGFRNVVTSRGMTWPLSETEKFGRETRRIATRLEVMLRSVDVEEPIRVVIESIAAPDARDPLTDEPMHSVATLGAFAQLNVRHLRALMDLLERRSRAP